MPVAQAVPMQAALETVPMPVAQAVPMLETVPMPVAPAVPMQAAPMPHIPPGKAAREEFSVGVGYTPTVPKGKWNSDLCDWCAAGGGICAAACCCPFVTGPQLYQKALGAKGSCFKWFGIMFACFIVRQVGQFLAQNTAPLRDGALAVNSMWIVWNAVHIGAALMLTIVGTIVLMAVRKRVREKDNIGVAGCGESEDCCSSFWCSCCTTIQIFNQFSMRCDTGYQMCTEEGIPTPAGARAGTVRAYVA